MTSVGTPYIPAGAKFSKWRTRGVPLKAGWYQAMATPPYTIVGDHGLPTAYETWRYWSGHEWFWLNPSSKRLTTVFAVNFKWRGLRAKFIPVQAKTLQEWGRHAQRTRSQAAINCGFSRGFM